MIKQIQFTFPLNKQVLDWLLILGVIIVLSAIWGSVTFSKCSSPSPNNIRSFGVNMFIFGMGFMILLFVLYVRVFGKQVN